MRAVKAILFDLDDTLINDTLGTQLALEHTCSVIAERCNVPPIELIAAIRDCARRFWRGSSHFDLLYGLGISSTEALYSDFRVESEFSPELPNWSAGFQEQVWEEALIKRFASSGVTFGEFIAIYRKFRIECVTLFEATLQTLAQLKSSYKLSIITNGPADLQSAKIKSAELEGFFDYVFISGREGIGKPETEIFERALESLEVRADEALMVGDSLQRDVFGAQSAGIRALRVVGESKAEPGNITSVDTDSIENIAELLTSNNYL